jgi:hypothetical protein
MMMMMMMIMLRYDIIITFNKTLPHRLSPCSFYRNSVSIFVFTWELHSLDILYLCDNCPSNLWERWTKGFFVMYFHRTGSLHGMTFVKITHMQAVRQRTLGSEWYWLRALYHACEWGKCDLCCLFVQPETSLSVSVSISHYTFRIHSLRMVVEEEVITVWTKRDDS